MTKTLQDLRQEGGYDSARKFAIEHDMVYATYCRYEREPEKIPVEVAWKLADIFDSTIDEVVGHETNVKREISHLRPASFAKYDAYESLSSEGKQLVMDALELAQMRDKKNKQLEEEKELRHWESVCQRYERAMWVKLNSLPQYEWLPLGAGAELEREQYLEFISDMARTKREAAIQKKYANLSNDLARNGGEFEGANPGDPDYAQRVSELTDDAINLELERAEAEDDETIKKIMAAYDRIHSPNQTYYKVLH